MFPKVIFSLFLGVLIAAFLFACSDDNDNPTYPFERTVSGISIAKRCANCYTLFWQHPIEKMGLEGYYIWLDTMVVNDSAQNISAAQMNAADTIIPYSAKGDGDSLSLNNLNNFSYANRDSLHIAIWAKYAGGDQGAVIHYYVHFGDDKAPSIPLFNDSVSANTIWIDWIRPTDQRDFYTPDSINGPIAGYNINIQAIDRTENIRDAVIRAYLAGNIVPSALHRNSNFRRRGNEAVLENATNSNQYSLGLAITDGKGFVSDNVSENSWRMEISGLRPEHSYKISMSAWDSSGNYSNTEKYIATTDQIAPSIANEFWYHKDSGDGFARINSNRLVLFWQRSLDQLPSGAYREVKSYQIEQWNGSAWEAISRINAVLPDDYYNARYNLENDTMIYNANGNYVSDTLRWILPGDTVYIRARAIDSSGHYSASLIKTIEISKGELWETKCPQNFVPVKKDTLKTNSSVFCIEKLEHSSNGNVLYAEAKEECEEAGFRLCTEQEWTAACNSGGGNYGVIEETNFSPAEFLSKNCGVGTGDSLSARNFDKRKKLCASPDGVRDLPGQLQEWVISANDSALIKGSSYPIFNGASIVELSQCTNRATPTSIKPRYTTDSIYIYRTGSRADTLFTRDTLRTLHKVLPPDSLKNTILVYSLSRNGKTIGTDYIDQDEYNRRGGDAWLEYLWAGFSYEKIATLKAKISGTETIKTPDTFLDPTVSFRCCSEPE